MLGEFGPVRRAAIKAVLKFLTMGGRAAMEHRFDIDLSSLVDCGGLHSDMAFTLEIKFPTDNVFS